MDDQPPPEKPLETATQDGELKPSVWPAEIAEQGKVYGFVDPNHGGDIVMAAMRIETWNAFNEKQKLLEARLANLSAENIELKQGRRPLLNSRIILPN
jgi:hypothetical protein